jgi:hypothetical protein
MTQVGKDRGEGPAPVWGLETALERGLDQALRLDVPRAVTE